MHKGPVSTWWGRRQTQASLVSYRSHRRSTTIPQFKPVWRNQALSFPCADNALALAVCDYRRISTIGMTIWSGSLTTGRTTARDCLAFSELTAQGPARMVGYVVTRREAGSIPAAGE